MALVAALLRIGRGCGGFRVVGANLFIPVSRWQFFAACAILVDFAAEFRAPVLVLGAGGRGGDSGLETARVWAHSRAGLRLGCFGPGAVLISHLFAPHSEPATPPGQHWLSHGGGFCAASALRAVLGPP